MGKVASDKCHKWVFKEPTECEPNISNYWQSSFDAVWVHILNSLPPHPITLLLLFLFCLFIIYKSKYWCGFGQWYVVFQPVLCFVFFWWLLCVSVCLMIDWLNHHLWCNLLQLPPEWIDQFESGIQVSNRIIVSFVWLLLLLVFMRFLFKIFHPNFICFCSMMTRP